MASSRGARRRSRSKNARQRSSGRRITSWIHSPGWPAQARSSSVAPGGRHRRGGHRPLRERHRRSGQVRRSGRAIAEPEAVLDDLDAVLDDLDAVRVLAVHPGVALARQQLDQPGRGGPLRDLHLEGHHHPVETGGAQRVQDGPRRVAAHRLPAAPAVQDRGAGEQQLQMVVELGHGADGGARGPHRIGLVDGDGRGDAVDGVHAGLVHTVEELAGVGGEGLDVAALAFAVDGVEGQRRLAGAADPSDDVKFAQREVEVDALEVVLSGAADADGGAGGHGRGSGGEGGRGGGWSEAGRGVGVGWDCPRWRCGPSCRRRGEGPPARHAARCAAQGRVASCGHCTTEGRRYPNQRLRREGRRCRRGFPVLGSLPAIPSRVVSTGIDDTD